MKKFSIILLFLILPLTTTLAQEENRIQEIGLTTSNFNNFGITYRTGKDNNSLWRFSALSSSINSESSNSNSTEINNSDLGIGIQVGKERRSTVSEKFELRYGLDLGYQYDHGVQERIETAPDQTFEDSFNSHEMAISGVFGFNFLVTKGFILGGEVLPRVYYRSFKRESNVVGTNTSATSETDRFGFNLNTSSIRLSFVYRF